MRTYTSPREAIIADEKYRTDIKRAREKAQAACDKVHERLRKREEKLFAQLEEIKKERNRIFRSVFRPIFDPLEEKACAEAEKRIPKADTPKGSPPTVNSLSQERHAQFMGGVGDEVWD